MATTKSKKSSRKKPKEDTGSQVFVNIQDPSMIKSDFIDMYAQIDHTTADLLKEMNKINQEKSLEVLNIISNLQKLNKHYLALEDSLKAKGINIPKEQDKEGRKIETKIKINEEKIKKDINVMKHIEKSLDKIDKLLSETGRHINTEVM